MKFRAISRHLFAAGIRVFPFPFRLEVGNTDLELSTYDFSPFRALENFYSPFSLPTRQMWQLGQWSWASDYKAVDTLQRNWKSVNQEVVGSVKHWTFTREIPSRAACVIKYQRWKLFLTWDRQSWGVYSDLQCIQRGLTVYICMNSAAQRSDLTVIYIIYTGTTQLDAATVNIYM